GIHAAPGPRPLTAAPARARLGSRTRHALQPRRRVRALPAREDRPPVRRREHRNRARARLPPARGRRMLSRLPLRLRLSAAFALVMAIVLAATGLVIYRTFSADLSHSTDRALAARSEEVAAVLGQASGSVGPQLAHLDSTEDDFAQVLRADGSVIAATPQ